MSEMLTPQNQDDEKKLSGFVRTLSEPLSKYGWPAWLVYILAIFGFIYLLNPTFGVFEFIPDNLPIIGNLDESVAILLVLAGIVEALEGKKSRKNREEDKPDESMLESSKPNGD